MNDGEDFDHGRDPIDDDGGRSRHDEFARRLRAAPAAGHWIVRKQPVGATDHEVRQFVGCERPIPRDEILDAVEIGKRRPRSENPH
ncbi:hypothetical protein ASG54_13855 [Aureimonas sp. Leaf460]|uniref:hypothetical protein n=1 Tax=Aureimonas sp. Leaf460 TaxID=1736384 RepID=UPI0006F7E1AE|nr:MULTISPECIES: hypothetical protein [unclassified Aureimonas]KQT69959.1 hypothetical protein ASG62_02360 [Aureimonas sp. Leaf427]KQT75885.1 hypothetical protein ASG54_13855 [Aureimonas sp. Leaf460]